MKGSWFGKSLADLHLSKSFLYIMRSYYPVCYQILAALRSSSRRVTKIMINKVLSKLLISRVSFDNVTTNTILKDWHQLNNRNRRSSGWCSFRADVESKCVQCLHCAPNSILTCCFKAVRFMILSNIAKERLVQLCFGATVKDDSVRPVILHH